MHANVHAVTGDLVFAASTVNQKDQFLRARRGLVPLATVTDLFRAPAHRGEGAFLYGAGADYALTRHFSLRAEYRGFVYKSPDFGLSALNTDSWTHTAQPSAGIAFRF